jgi:uncharacterized MAPEG superfamily protein
MENFYANFPVKFNAVICVLLTLTLAYYPLIEKVSIIRAAARKDPKGIHSTAHSRFLTNALMQEKSVAGLRVSTLVGCHTNGLEAFVIFSTAVLLALTTKVPKYVVNGAATAFLLCRCLYTVVYLTSLNGYLRTVVFAMGMFICVSLMISAAGRFDPNSY